MTSTDQKLEPRLKRIKRNEYTNIRIIITVTVQLQFTRKSTTTRYDDGRDEWEFPYRTRNGRLWKLFPSYVKIY